MKHLIWQDFSDLNQIDYDISEYGYSKEYIELYSLLKRYHYRSMTPAKVNLAEPIEVIKKKGRILWRNNETYQRTKEPEMFLTQNGRFLNHNHGEFRSWLEIADEGSDKHKTRLFDGTIKSIEGNFCDMFDCGKFSFAISNCTHMGLGYFSIIRISEDLEIKTVYTNKHLTNRPSFTYAGRFRNSIGWGIIASGFIFPDVWQLREGIFEKITQVFQIDEEGKCSVLKKWDVQISDSNSVAFLDNYAYFGQNRMVTRFNLETGEMSFFTNKSEEELSVLSKMY